MLADIATELSGKRILLLGFGAEGRSSLALLQKLCVHKSLAIADQNTALEVGADIPLFLGENYLSGLEEYDLVLKSPGIPLPKAMWQKYGHKITSQIELFLKHFKGLSIGVTGTKGKTTTSSMLHSILREGTSGAHLLGNIGTPVLSEVDQIKPEDTVLLELSSHQLQNIKATPRIALLLNLFPEHLEYYGSFEAYRDAKFAILSSDREEDIAFVAASLKDTVESFQTKRKLHFVDTSQGESFPFLVPDQLSGPHHQSQLHFISTVASHLKISISQIEAGLSKFRLPPHRTEILGTFGGIKWINDSAATIPEATICALKMFPEVNTLIVGGFDRGVDLAPLLSYLEATNAQKIICIPQTGSSIYQHLNSLMHLKERVFFCQDLPEAVALAYDKTPKGGSCLFSPSAASYHAYRNFAERGEHLKEMLNHLQG